ncbi:site-specific integrase [Fructilactobacillus hinvesii]|uniref:Site-specific integrase n=1 Tax=Fructilactobacillus hinvesii TaxID=2940300 RepID=A0ABY5BQX1_9LACO|nr:tyrosine-type recombinase/integrase [Fructilactobacillus hinvesii]USS87505.1 site-specific integrase [Fructilactobacillus hinvesii]
MEIYQYEVKGQKYYRLKAYLGIDPHTGKKKSVTRSKFKTKKAAKLAFNKLLIQFEDNKLEPSQRNEKLKFKDVYDEWITSYKETVRNSTYINTISAFKNHILPVFADQYINTITISEIQKTVNRWFKADSKVNCKKWANFVASVFNFAIRMGYYKGLNPAKSITLPKMPEIPGEKKPNFYTQKELNKFLDSLSKDEKVFNRYVFFRLLGFSGMRKGEILAIEWKDVDFSKRYVRINKSVSVLSTSKDKLNPPKTKAGYRAIPLDPKTINLLQQWKIRCKEYKLMVGQYLSETDAVFEGRSGKFMNPNSPQKWLKKALETSGTHQITLHGFRKSYCTALVSAGVPIKEVQRRMGHDDIKTTLDVYSFVTHDQIEKANRQFEKYISL